MQNRVNITIDTSAMTMGYIDSLEAVSFVIFVDVDIKNITNEYLSIVKKDLAEYTGHPAEKIILRVNQTTVSRRLLHSKTAIDVFFVYNEEDQRAGPVCVPAVQAMQGPPSGPV